MKNLRKRTEGFTIIEVMIVLVIAAVILLIVFLAVPALQRSSRNTQRKEDVANALTAVNEFASNNTGAYPTTGTVTSGTLTLTGAANTISSSSKLGYYKATTVQTTQVSAATNADTLVIVTDAKCGGTTGTTTGQTRSVAAVYGIENGPSTVASVCQEL